MRIVLFIFLIFVTYACNNLEFVYNENKNLSNPLYGKTIIKTSGENIIFMNSYIPMFFGKSSNAEFALSIDISENQTKRSVEKNQATSNLTYELRFTYVIKSIREDCVSFEKEILSTFSIIPKSSGYNFGTDVSLEKKYELVVRDNFNNFITYLSDQDLHNCI